MVLQGARLPPKQSGAFQSITALATAGDMDGVHRVYHEAEDRQSNRMHLCALIPNSDSLINVNPTLAIVNPALVKI